MMFDECAPASHVYIAFPAYSGDITIHTMYSLIHGIGELYAAGIAVTTNFVGGCCYLDHTRNLLANKFMAQSEASDLLFIDADVGFDPAAAVLIAQTKRPVVAGVYPKKTDTLQWPVHFESPTIQLTSDGLIETSLLPTGFMKINRRVLDEMKPHCQTYKDPQEGTLVAYFHTEIRKDLYWGEDYQFCHDWQMLGGKCYCLPDINFSHTGQKQWKGNLMDWIRQSAVSHKTIPQSQANSSAA